METIESLPLFSKPELNLNIINNISCHKEETSTSAHKFTTPASTHKLPIVDKALDIIFPEQQYEDKTIRRAKEILGEIGKEMTVDEIKTLVSEVQYLCDTWLDKYERELFNGMTLNELLNEG